MFKTCGVLLHPAHIKNGRYKDTRTTSPRRKQPISAATKRNIRHRTKNKHQRNTNRQSINIIKLHINQNEFRTIHKHNIFRTTLRRSNVIMEEIKKQ